MTVEHSCSDPYRACATNVGPLAGRCSRLIPPHNIGAATNVRRDPFALRGMIIADYIFIKGSAGGQVTAPPIQASPGDRLTRSGFRLRDVECRRAADTVPPSGLLTTVTGHEKVSSAGDVHDITITRVAVAESSRRCSQNPRALSDQTRVLISSFSPALRISQAR
jgi:hypothetical protein